MRYVKVLLLWLLFVGCTTNTHRGTSLTGGSDTNPVDSTIKKTDYSYLDTVVTTVKRVVDGDTFETVEGFKVRLIGIDTPESWKSGKLDRDS